MNRMLCVCVFCFCRRTIVQPSVAVPVFISSTLISNGNILGWNFFSFLLVCSIVQCRNDGSVNFSAWNFGFVCLITAKMNEKQNKMSSKSFEMIKMISLHMDMLVHEFARYILQHFFWLQDTAHYLPTMTECLHYKCVSIAQILNR